MAGINSKPEDSLLLLAETMEGSLAVAALLKKLSVEAERSAGVSEVVAMVKEGGVASLKVHLALCGRCACRHLCLPVHCVGVSENRGTGCLVIERALSLSM